MSTESDKARDDDEDQDKDLKDAEEVLESESPLESCSMEHKGESDASEANQTEGPSFSLDVGGDEDVFAKDKRVTSRPC